MSKVVDEADGGRSLEWVVDCVDVDVAFVEKMVKHIDGLDGGRTLLFVAKYQINPLVEMCTDVVTLQCLHGENTYASNELRSHCAVVTLPQVRHIHKLLLTICTV